MTIIRMLSPEALVGLVAGEGSHRRVCKKPQPAKTGLLFELPDANDRRRVKAAGRRYV